MPVKTIGETNGIWAVLLKLLLLTYTPVLALMAWLVVGQVLDNEFRSQGPRSTPADIEAQIALVNAQTEIRIAIAEIKIQALTPLIETVSEMKERLAKLESRLAEALKILSSGKQPSDVFRLLEEVRAELRKEPK